MQAIYTAPTKAEAKSVDYNIKSIRKMLTAVRHIRRFIRAGDTTYEMLTMPINADTEWVG